MAEALAVHVNRPGEFVGLAINHGPNMVHQSRASRCLTRFGIHGIKVFLNKFRALEAFATVFLML